MINFILAYVVKSKNFAIGIIGVILLLFIVGFVNNYFETKYKIKEYQRIEEEVKNQNLNVKENVEIIKKRNINLNIDDRKRLLEKMFSE
jgi:hypothetical protein